MIIRISLLSKKKSFDFHPFLSVFFLYLVTFTLISFLFFPDLTAAPKSLFNLTTTTEIQPPTITPNPEALSPGWWRYFDVNINELAERIKKTEEMLHQTISTLPEDQRAEANLLVGRILINLRALEQVKNSSLLPQAVEGVEMQSKYTLEQLLNLFRKFKTSQTYVSDEEDDVRDTRRSISSTRNGIDTLLASYLSLPPHDPTRIPVGLELMANQTALLVSEQQLKIKIGRLEGLKANSEKLEASLSIAEERLTRSPEAQEGLQRAIKKAEQAMESAQKNLQKIEVRLLELQPDTALGRAKSEYNTQLLVLTSLQEERAKIDLAILNLQKAIYQAQSDPSEETLTTLSKQIIGLKIYINDIKIKINDWQNISDREFKRATSDLNSEKTDLELIKIQQRRVDIAQESLIEIQQLSDLLRELQFLLALAKRIDQSHTSRFAYFATSVTDFLQRSWNSIVSWTRESLFKIGEVPLTPFNLLRAIAIILAALLLSRLIQLAFLRAAENQWRIAKTTFFTLSRLAHYFILLLGIIIGLVSLGIDFTNVALVAGALSVGIGFGLQTVVNNFLSGLIILFEKNLKIGDFIELESGYSGYVTGINVRTTLLRTNDGIEVVIPNSEITNTKLVNWTLTDAVRRVHVPFSVAYGSDKDLVRKAVLEAADRVPHTLRGQTKYRPPEIQLKGFGDYGLNFHLVVWVDDRASKHIAGAIADYLWEIDNSFRHYNIKIPVPPLDLLLKNKDQGSI